MRARYIYEKFEEESDPVDDMGIGMPALIKKYKKKIGHKKSYLSKSLNDDIAANLILDIGGIRDYMKGTVTYLPKETIELYFRMLEYLFRVEKTPVNKNNTYMFSKAYSIRDDDLRNRMLQLLLKYGLQINSLSIPRRDDATPGEIKTIKMLIHAGLDQRTKESVKTTFKNNVLSWAAKEQNTELMKYALKLGADASTKNHFALQQALEMNDKEMIKILIKEMQKNPEYK